MWLYVNLWTQRRVYEDDDGWGGLLSSWLGIGQAEFKTCDFNATVATMNLMNLPVLHFDVCPFADEIHKKYTHFAC